MQDNPVIGRAGNPLGVKAALELAKGALESFTVHVVGEVSEVSVKPGYKAAYFTIKDSSTSLPCMMWNNRYRAQGIDLTVGQLVEVVGRFTLYVAKGRMNFDVFSFSLAGEGDLRLKVANLARKLEREGLMNPARKRPLPAFPERVGVVTSPRGAAIHDVLRTMRRRFPVARVLVCGVPVEGPMAPAGIVAGIEELARAGAEVVLVVRGGGSFEDLMPFNDESLARAIALCPVPVVTGIGHEPDTSIADMVSDVRASTPTAAAEAVTPARESLDALLANRSTALSTAAHHALMQARAQVDRTGDRELFRNPMYLFSGIAQSLDVVSDRLARALPSCLARDADALALARERLGRALPHLVERRRVSVEHASRALRANAAVRLTPEVATLSQSRTRLARSCSTAGERFGLAVAAAAARLEDLSPVRVVARGYAIVRARDGAIVHSVADAPPGAEVAVTVADGVLACAVKSAQGKAVDGGLVLGSQVDCKTS